MARSLVEPFAPRLGVDGKQLIHPRHDRHRHRILGIQLRRFEKRAACMRPATSMHQLRPTHLLIGCVTVRLQNSFELVQKLFRSVTSAPQAKVEDRRSGRSTVLPQIRLMVFAAAVVHLHRHRCLIGLNISAP